MSLTSLLPIALQGSLMLVVFALGLQATVREGTCLFRQPKQLLRVVLAMNVIMPVSVVMAIRAFNLDPAVEVALFALALSPVPVLHAPVKTGPLSRVTRRRATVGANTTPELSVLVLFV